MACAEGGHQCHEAGARPCRGDWHHSTEQRPSGFWRCADLPPDVYVLSPSLSVLLLQGA